MSKGASYLIATGWNRIERIIRVSQLGPEAMGDTKGVWDLFKLVLSKTAHCTTIQCTGVAFKGGSGRWTSTVSGGSRLLKTATPKF